MTVRFVVFVQLLLLLCSRGVGQEIHAQVQVNAPGVQNLNPRQLHVLQQVLQESFNQRSWSGQELDVSSKIQLGIVVNISSFDGVDHYQGTAVFVVSRPIFGSTYASPLLNYVDPEFHFNYAEGNQMDFRTDQTTNELSGLIAFYAHVMLGIDRDSFALLGGSENFEEAYSVLQQFQSARSSGWRPDANDQGRYWLIHNLRDRRYESYRIFFYRYHRLGLDELSLQSDSSASKLFFAETLTLLQEVPRFAAGNVLSEVLFSTKHREFAGILQLLDSEAQEWASALLMQMDPMRASEYEAAIGK